MGHGERRPMVVSIARAALRLDRSTLIENLVVPMRRQFSVG